MARALGDMQLLQRSAAVFLGERGCVFQSSLHKCYCNDLINVGICNNIIYGGKGNDTIYGGVGKNYINLELIERCNREVANDAAYKILVERRAA
jgi:hypothetical protein